MRYTATQWNGSGKGHTGLGLPGRAALTLAGLHVLVLFFPPIPPDVKGSLWSYLLAGLAVVLSATEVHARAPELLAGWTDARSTTRGALVLGAVFALVVSGLAMLAVAPELFHRWSDDEGVYQPLTMLAFLTATLIVTSAAREADDRDERQLRLLAAGFVVLFLEEIDYFGLFGGLVGRVDGVYVGSVHDLLHVASRGGVSWGLAAALGSAAAAGAFLAWRLGYLDLRGLAGLLSPASMAWLLLGGALMATAQGMDVGRLGLGGNPAALEELLEVSGAVLWLGFALESARRARHRGPSDRERARDEFRATV